MLAMTVMTVNTKRAEHEKKIAGQPPTGRKGKPLQVYVDDDLTADIHEWAKQQPGRAPNQSEAIRLLLRLALSGKGGKK